MAETTKAAARREREGWFEKFIALDRPGLDIGAGADPLNATFRRWDKADGDATFLEGVPDAAFWSVYSSHCLEHLADPVTALRNWWRVLRPGGFLVVVVPARDLYEKRITLPSRWNEEHKTFWLPDRSEPPCTFSLADTIRQAIPDGELIHVRILDEGYEGNGDGHAGGEYSIEAVVRKA